MSSQFHQAALNVENYSQKVLTRLNEMRLAEVLCDYTLVAGEQQIKVHRSVMAACSDYFRAMLTSEMYESKEDRVDLLGLTFPGLVAMVNFAYTGTLQVTADNLEDVLIAATC